MFTYGRTYTDTGNFATKKNKNDNIHIFFKNQVEIMTASIRAKLKTNQLTRQKNINIIYIVHLIPEFFISLNEDYVYHKH